MESTVDTREEESADDAMVAYHRQSGISGFILGLAAESFLGYRLGEQSRFNEGRQTSSELAHRYDESKLLVMLTLF